MDKNTFIKKYNMKELTESDGVALNIIYATPNNFTGEVLYDEPICMLREKTAKKILMANKILNEKGYKLMIWDAFRPIKYQRKMFEVYPDENFVANPDTEDCPHCKGSAVDVTICKYDNSLIKMPTEFDHFGIESHRDYYNNLDSDSRKNAILLENTMKQCGFTPFPYEWWHYDDNDDYDIIHEMYE